MFLFLLLFVCLFAVLLLLMLFFCSSSSFFSSFFFFFFGGGGGGGVGVSCFVLYKPCVCLRIGSIAFATAGQKTGKKATKLPKYFFQIKIIFTVSIS